MRSDTCDIAILGGGLAGALVALALADLRPDLRVIVVERGPRLGGEHVWSFFASDVPAAGQALVEPMIAARWEGYDVHFPRLSRRLPTPYCSVTSARLDARVRAVLPAGCLWTEAQVTAADATGVTIADGRTIAAGAVIDARGAAAMPHLSGGWQKFMGQTLELAAPHGLDRPIVMDARVAQRDGYRFVYCLPFSATGIFVEDTYYSDTPDLDLPELRRRIAAYAADRGWRVEAIAYEETGVLPVIAGGDFEAFWRDGESGCARIGSRAALVHPLTSYSLPDAVGLALYLGALDNLSGPRLQEACHAWAAKHWRDGRFYRMLSTMLFGAAQPHERWRVLERFYRLPAPLIERFYAGHSTLPDRIRVLAGRPPVPLGSALACLAGRGRPLADLGEPA